MISEDRVLSKLEDLNDTYDNFETAVISLIEGKNIKPSKLSLIREELGTKLKSLDVAIKQYCK